MTRIRAVRPGEAWQRDDRGYAAVPLSAPLITDREITAQIPGLSIRPGDHQPHVRGKIREYLPL